jgi:type 1 fimbria pilin
MSTLLLGTSLSCVLLMSCNPVLATTIDYECRSPGVNTRTATFSLTPNQLSSEPGTLLQTKSVGTFTFCSASDGEATYGAAIPAAETVTPPSTIDSDGFVGIAPGLAIRFELVRYIAGKYVGPFGSPKAAFGTVAWPIIEFLPGIQDITISYELTATLKRVDGDLVPQVYRSEVGSISAPVARSGGLRTDKLSAQITVPVPACKVKFPQQVVPLKTVKSVDMNALNLGEAANIATNFKIHLSCLPTASNMQLLMLDGNASGADDYFRLSPQSTAGGVALKIETVGNPSLVRPGVAIPLSGATGTGDYSPEFSVKFVKTEASVHPGDVKATATFTVIYD